MKLIRVSLPFENSRVVDVYRPDSTLPKEEEGCLFLSQIPGLDEPLVLAVSHLVARNVNEIVSLVYPAELRLLSPEYFAALDSKKLPFHITQFPIDRHGAPLDLRTFDSEAASVGQRILEGKRILLHGGDTFGRSATFAIATLCSLGTPLAIAMQILARDGLGPANGAQQFALERLYGSELVHGEMAVPCTGIKSTAA